MEHRGAGGAVSYDYEHTRQAWKDLAVIFGWVAVVTIAIWLFGWHTVLVAAILGLVIYSVFIA